MIGAIKYLLGGKLPNEQSFEDRTCVRTFVWNPREATQNPLPAVDSLRPAVSLIATVRNEGATLDRWLASLRSQSRPPDEIVIVDGGSDDDTWSILEAYSRDSVVPFRAIRHPGANIARGRNLAIAAAAGPVIACTDAGCVLSKDWLAAITAPFAEPDVEVAAGYYRALVTTDVEKVMAAYFVQPVASVDPRTFLPSARSIAFTKTAWERAGGFPEWLRLTAEDTLFDLALKRVTTQWAFVPEAIVDWQLKRTLRSLFRQVRGYSYGDAEAGLFPDMYRGRINLWTYFLGAMLAGAIGIALAVGGRAPAWLSLTIVTALLAARRVRQVTVVPTWTHDRRRRIKAILQSIAVALTINLAMSTGFLAGMRSRRARSPGVAA